MPIRFLAGLVVGLPATVLLIGPDRRLARLIAEALTPRHRVRHLGSRDAIAVLEAGEEDVELVLIDCDDEEDAEVTLLELHDPDAYPDLPVVALTARGKEFDDQAWLSRAGGCRILEKPFDLARLQATVSNAIGVAWLIVVGLATGCVEQLDLEFS